MAQFGRMPPLPGLTMAFTYLPPRLTGTRISLNSSQSKSSPNRLQSLELFALLPAVNDTIRQLGDSWCLVGVS